MQALRVGSETVFILSIDKIPQQRMADMCHMNSYLMGPSGLKPALNICIIFKSFKYLYMSYGSFSVRDSGRHLFPVFGIPAYKSLDRPLILFNNTMYYSSVSSCDGMIFQLLCNASVRIVIFACNNGARGIFIYSVDDTGA